MKLILADNKNLPAIMQIISEAQAYLASLGIDQWQDGYPKQSIIQNDIFNGESYMVTNKENQTLATTMYTTQSEPSYSYIEGNWLTSENAKYGVIHRMAVSNHYRSKGAARFIFSQCEQNLIKNHITSMRIDTHEENKGMQALLKSLGYAYCGIIILNSGDKRLAFEKLM